MWESDTAKIYEAYSIYHQSNGAEQAVFGELSGRATARSARILERLCSQVQLPETGRLLDVGCGNGSLLRAFSPLAPLWSIVATELNDKYRAMVESIDNVEALYICTPEEVPGSFNLITMIHVLEHIPGPIPFLTKLWEKLELSGLVVVEVPDYTQNPFDLMVADHCTHFSVNTIANLVQGAGYELLLIVTDWVPKELTVVARKTEHKRMNCTQVSTSDNFDFATASLQWLESVLKSGRKFSAMDNFGLFGTAIAATWLCSELEDSVSFFVDEDPHRVGKAHMGRPVYHPHDVPSGSHVFMALPTTIAEGIVRRVAKSGVTYHLPLPFHI
jgi:SAM-dependent methyltransferase